jgi:serine/threonine protein kinase
MDPATAARIIRDLADAVSHAHSMGVVHRDIKPGNIMIDDRGRPRLIDFGLARRSDVESDLTRDGAVVGTPAYMSPEQAIGLSRQVDERSDVYSLGVIFYELLCGRRPQDAPGDGGPEPPGPSGRPRTSPSARAIDRRVPRPLDAICARAMAPSPADRYPSAKVLAEVIDAWLARRRRPGHRVAIGLVVLCGALAMAAAAVSVPRRVSTHTPADARGRAGVPGVSVGKEAPAPPRHHPPFVYSRHSNNYHLSTCGRVDRIKAANRLTLSTPEEARVMGLQPCTECHPSRVRPGAGAGAGASAGPP